jgi:Zn ribbon nucleic-acid-binding protein
MISEVIVLERAPFNPCPKCQTENAFGMVWVGGSSMTRRCVRCGHKAQYELPKLSKKVIYLDQNAISNVFKVSSGKLRTGSNREFFWKKVTELSKRVFLLQQAVFPLSDIHRDETLVYLHHDELNLAHEMLGGDVSFKNSESVIMAQTLEFFDYYLGGKPPPNTRFDLESVIEGEKDCWISDLHITASMDFSVFAERVRSDRDRVGPALSELLQFWAAKKPSFRQALLVELEGYGRENRRALQNNTQKMSQAVTQNDSELMYECLSSRVYRQFMTLRTYAERNGISSSEATAEVLNFWDWKGNWQLPHNKISSYLFAGLARRVASGQRNYPKVGIFNDFRAISTYAPYVDAMFLDNECANILGEQPTKDDLNLSSRIFSTKTGEEYIHYLESIEADTPETVRARACEIYGLD